MNSLELTRPLITLILLPLVLVLWMFFVRSLSDFPWRQRLMSLVTRISIVLLLVLSLAGLTWLRQTDEQFVIFVTDGSLSIGDDAVQTAERFFADAAEFQGPHQTVWLPFAADVGMVQDEPFVNFSGSSPSSARMDDPIGTVRRDGTDLASALEAAAGYLPPGYVPQIVLLSDGNQTAGDALSTATGIRVPISVVPLPTWSEPEVQVSEVRVPAEVREGEPFYVEAVLHSNHDDEGLIEVFRGDHKVVSERRSLKSGENSFRFQQTIERERLAAFSVRVSGLKNDTLLDNNVETGLVYTAGKPRILLIESDPHLIRELAYALEDEGIQVDVRPPQGMPDSLADLQNYECLVLSNVPATALSQQQMELARTWVQELGGGFLMLGGEQSFGLGGYYRSTLEEILPVRSDFEKEKEKPSLAMVLVIDKSGSMDGDKIEMAKSAARSAVEILGQRDQIAVLAFDGETYVVSEMQSVNNKVRISDEIARIAPGGGTAMYPAMEMSHEMLLATSAKLKHVILLTDGVSTPGDFESMAQQMTSAKITVSTVAIGDSSETELLETIARVGKGRHYVTSDPAQVPQIFAKETVTASQSAIDEQPFVPQVIRATHALKDIDMESAPFLLGYVMTRPKPTSEVILVTEKGDPLLAWWRYGLGMTAAFTSDAKSRWAAEWITWPGYGKFWTQVIRQTMRKSDTGGIRVTTARNGSTAQVMVDAVSDTGRYLNQADVELTLIDPGLKQQKLKLRQSAPGRYVIDIPTPVAGSYHLEVAVSQNGQIVSRQSRGLIIGYSDELRIRPTDEQLLRAVAAVSGGIYSPEPREVFERRDQSAARPVALWPWLLTAAAFLLVLDVALRRIDFTLHLPLLRGSAG